MDVIAKNYSIVWKENSLLIQRKGYGGLWKFIFVFCVFVLVSWSIKPVIIKGNTPDLIFVGIVLTFCFGILSRMTLRWLYPHTEIVFDSKIIIRSSILFLLPKRIFSWNELKDIVVLTKAVNENANSAEGRVIDFRKSLRIITENKEFEILYVVTRQENIEQELELLAETIQQRSK